ncbi:LytTR family DNA-binding domain-containing protein [Pleomorphomonas sp. JP5]|uniref:LytTR family DNA-binding domain-containing protein n=1 Tax=Pleomorphomonas sp. JP5 TaxID=2942998 RepID=UPI002044CE18|nr:LytTR family DNA-binding domain-containing protein [Pleomorphomonas sp. JP5]MCM5557276.1 LytTR family transcriptional regulator [Pleomorphomonas sp. JP5]
MDGSNVQLALRRWRAIVGSAMFRAIVLAATAITTASGISSGDSWRDTLGALAINGVEAFSSAALATLLILLVEPRLSFIAHTGPRYALAGIAASPAVLIVVLAIEVLLRQADPTATYVGRVAITVLVSVAAIATVAGLAARGDRRQPTETPAAEPAKTCAFLRRLPPRLGTDLTRVSVYDHYVEAHTRRGHELILIRFSDALAELEGGDGLQIHRSHWVANGAVRCLMRSESRSLLVELDDGTRLPVSRSREAAVRAAGFPLEKADESA